MASNVTLENVGPITHLDLPVQPGTIVVLTGANGVGKTKALEAVEKIASGRGSIDTRDRSKGAVAEGFGVRIKVGRGGANRRTVVDEQLVVESLEDRISIADLVDPGVKDPAAADARRIKALVQLANVPADVGQFAGIDPGGLESIRQVVKESTTSAGDLVDMAARIKRDYETASRAKAEQAKQLEAEIRAAAEANREIDLQAPHDRDELNQALENAIAAQSAIRERVKAFNEGRDKAETARDMMKASEAGFDGLDVDEAEARFKLAESDVTTAQQKVDELERQLTEAKKTRDAFVSQRDIAEERLTSARQHASDVAAWQKTIDEFDLTCPSTGDIAKAEADVKKARHDVERGAVVREAIERARKSSDKGESMKALKAEAESLREIGRSTENVLSEIVGAFVDRLRVDEEFRLVVTGTKRGETYFAELSHGERWKLALDIAVDAFRRVDKPGLLVIPQEAWESLDGTNRRLIAEHIRETDLAIVTAEAARGDVSGDLSYTVAG